METLNVVLLTLAGLLLRQIKDFWRVALLMSTLLYPSTDLARDSNGHLDLDRRKEIFLSVESTITELGLLPCAHLGNNSLYMSVNSELYSALASK